MKTNSLNTYKFCKEFEKIFGPYKSKRLTPKQRVLSGWRTFMSSPYSNFVYEISLYLNIPVSEVKQLLTKDCQYLYPLCEYVYKRFRKRFRKNGAKSGLASVFQGIGMISRFFEKKFYDGTLKFLLYETLILGIDVTFRKRNERRSLEIIAEKSNDFL